jgi:hypothetical protein
MKKRNPLKIHDPSPSSASIKTTESKGKKSKGKNEPRQALIMTDLYRSDNPFK